MRKVLAVGFLVFTSGFVYAKFVYYADDQKVVDAENGWEFKAILKNTDELYLDGTGCSYSGSSPCSLNLTEITDADGKTYKAVSFKALPEAAKPYLTEFIAPDCQKIEGEKCFNSCTELLKVELNENVTYIGAFAFYKCSKLENFTPRTLAVEYVYKYTFHSCSNLRGGFTLSSCKKILEGGFNSAANLEWIEAPEATVIGDAAFYGCSVLTSVSVPKIKQICNQAFQNCTSLTTESVNGMMHRGVELLATNARSTGGVAFGGCTSIEGPLIWNMPQLQTNVVWYSMFSSCSNLREVRILSEVAEIREAAFKNIAPGAAVYMPMKAPAVFGGNAVCRQLAPYPKIYLKGNYDAWFKVMGVSHQILPKERFNDPTWTSTTTLTWYGRMRKRMSDDTEMCTTTKTGNTITEVAAKDKNVIAFVAFNDASFCWVLKIPEQGFCVIVR